MTGVVEVDARGARATVTAPLRHLCPYVNEKDKGTVTISWDVNGATLELHSLREWLDKLATVKVSHEELTVAIKDKITVTQGLTGVRVTTRWKTAGMDVEVTV